MIDKIINQYQQIRENLSPEDSSLFDTIQDTVPIVGDGSLDSTSMVIARDLGADEVQEKKPLIGRAGKLFRAALKHYNLSVYMTNLVPYKPKDNIAFPSRIRDKFVGALKNQIDIIQPEIILTLGKESLEFMLGHKVVGVMKELDDYYLGENFNNRRQIGSSGATTFWSAGHSFYLYPMLHPSYFVRKGIDSTNINDYLINIDRNLEFKHYFNLPLVLTKRKMSR